ncbi:MAG: cupin domain-containing protein [Syntrophales bacterium]|jgi:mannose-6-phosphate isomerase-like protein (cupin superfamily)|nr:cupin domain-containing protein [Syntrophales bacterium]
MAAGYFFDTAGGEWKPHPRFAGAFVLPLIAAAHNPGLTVSLVRLMPGAALPVHVHQNSIETFYVLRGIGVCRVGESECKIKPGWLGYAPPVIEHSIRNTGDEPLEAISIFNPPL